VHKAQKVTLAILVSKDLPVQRVLKDHRDRKALKASKVKLALPAQTARTASTVRMAIHLSRALIISTAKMVRLVLMVRTDSRAKTAPMVIPLSGARTTGRMLTRQKWCPL
jgi:hypothetical protein